MTSTANTIAGLVPVLSSDGSIPSAGASAMSIDQYSNQSAITTTVKHHFGLPTPNSLPTITPLPTSAHVATPNPAHTAGSSPASIEEDDDEDHEDSAQEDPDTELATFVLDDVDMDLQLHHSDTSHHGSTAPLAPPPGPTTTDGTRTAVSSDNAHLDGAPRQLFSSQVLIRRPFRARYADAQDPTAPILDTTAALSSPTLSAAASEPSGSSLSLPPSPPHSSSAFKRTFEQITPSSAGSSPSESTPPLLQDDSLSTSTTAAATRPQTFRHSFESQRAVASSSLRTRFQREHHEPSNSTLRRRSPMPSRPGSRDRRIAPSHDFASGGPSLSSPSGSAVMDDALSTTSASLGFSSDRSKRRRPSGTPDLAGDAEEAAMIEDTTRLTTSFGNQRASLSARFQPRGLAIDPILTTTGTSSISSDEASSSTRSPDGGEPSTVAPRRNRLSLTSTLARLPSTVLRSSPGSSPRIGTTSNSSGSSSRDELGFSRTSSQSTDGGEHASHDPTSSSATRPRRSSASFPVTLASFRLGSGGRNHSSPSSPAPSFFPTASAASGASSAVEASSAIGSALLRPRSARARPDPMRERQFDPFVAFWREEREHERSSRLIERRGREILDEAAMRLEAAEATMREARREIGVGSDSEIGSDSTNNAAQQHGQDELVDGGMQFVQDRLAATNASIARTTRLLEQFPNVPRLEPREAGLPQLPSISHLPNPSTSRPSTSEQRPVVGVRVGQGWPRSSPAANAPSGDTGFVGSPPASPRSEDESGPAAVSISRTRSFLSQLRSRRPRLSRNSTGVPAPEEGSTSSLLATPSGELTATGSDNLSQRPWWPTVETDWSMNTEQTEADRLNERLLRVRRATDQIASASSPTGVGASFGTTPSGDVGLFGQISDSSESSSSSAFNPETTFQRRLRGPTERANSLWRMGRHAETADNGTTAAMESIDQMDNLTTPSNVLHFPPSLTSPNSDADGPLDSTAWRRIQRHDSPFVRASSPSPRASRRRERDSGGDLDLGLDFELDLDLDPVWGRPGAGRSTSASDGNGSGNTNRVSDSGAGSTPDVLGRGFVRRWDRTRTGNIFGDDDDTSSSPPQLWMPGNLPPMLPSGRPGLVDNVPVNPNAPQRRSGTVNWSSSLRDPTIGRRSSIGGNADSSNTSNERRNSRRTLADALAGLGSRGADSPPTRRRSTQLSETDAIWPTNESGSIRRRSPAWSPSETGPRSPGTVDREGRQDERLANIRRERLLLQSFLGSRSRNPELSPPIGEMANPIESEPPMVPRSPGGRLRGLGDFLRGFGPGAGRIAALFDDDFIGFFGRDSVALDPRNFVDDDDFDSSYESLIRLSERLGDVKPRGVKQEKLEALTKFKYKDWPFPQQASEATAVGVASTSAVKMDEDQPALARRGLEKEERCAVCLQDYEDEDEIVLTVCKHGFHNDCLMVCFYHSSS
ncbi:hypothetical protein T439DRAFT_324353 [Meredithblackwellia eburnea MCA 4105]